MITLRVRFSGLCLFHRQNDETVVRVLEAPGHRPELWIETATARNQGHRTPDDPGKEECVLENHNGLESRWATIDKYHLQESEVLYFEAGLPPGPLNLPGVASLNAIHPPGLGPVDVAKGVGAILRLTSGSFEVGPKRDVIWHAIPGGTSPPVELPLWCDLVVLADLRSIKLLSPRGSWDLAPESESEMRIWVLSDDVGSTVPYDRKGKHLEHQMKYIRNSRYQPWPELVEDIPSCTEVRKTVGSTFCPDGEFTE